MRDQTREKPSTIQGMTKFQAKHVAKYAFGDFFDSFDVDWENLEYRVTVKADTDQDIIDYFLEYWNKGKNCWRIRRLSKE
jgi:hypothetical protein